MERCNASMQLTRAADYGVRVMVHMAGLARGERLSLAALAQATASPVSFLSKVMQALARAKLITSHRGQSGGFEITSRGRQASMLQVVEAIDGPMRLNLCLKAGKTCGRKAWCPAHMVWADAQKALYGVLGAALVSEMAVRQSSCVVIAVDEGNARRTSETSS